MPIGDQYDTSDSTEPLWNGKPVIDWTKGLKDYDNNWTPNPYRLDPKKKEEIEEALDELRKLVAGKTFSTNPKDVEIASLKDRIKILEETIKRLQDEVEHYRHILE